MTEQDLKKLQSAFVGLASIYHRQPYTDIALKFMTRQLEDLNFNSVMKAIDVYCKDSKNRVPPLPAQLREIVCPTNTPKDEARLLAARIIGCIDRYGYTWVHGAMMGGKISFSGAGKQHETFEKALHSELGEAGSYTVQVLGGWAALCNRQDDTAILQAQIRDTVESILVKSKNGSLYTPTPLPGSDKNLIDSRVQKLLPNKILTEEKC